jgi:DNA-binding transcriptional LysR family regulator
LCGAGVALLPTYLASPLIQQGQLVALLTSYQPMELGIFAVYASRKHMSSALRAILDFLAQRFAPEPAWDSIAASSR